MPLKIKSFKFVVKKLKQKGQKLAFLFMRSFQIGNDTPELLMEVAKWWITINQFDHFEKAAKIKQMIMAMKNVK